MDKTYHNKMFYLEQAVRKNFRGIVFFFVALTLLMYTTDYYFSIVLSTLVLYKGLVIVGDMAVAVFKQFFHMTPLGQKKEI